MGKKILFLLTAVLFVVHESHTGEVTDLNSEPLDYFTDAQQALEDLKLQVADAVNQALIDIIALNGEITDLRSTVALTSETTLREIYGVMETKVDEIRGYATDANGEQIERCIMEWADEMDRLPVYVMELVDECLTGIEESTTSQLDGYFTQVQNSLTTVDTFQTQLDTCVLLEDDECAAQIFIEILLETLEATTKIDELTNEAKILVESLEQTMPACFNDRQENTNFFADLIISYMKNCSQID